MTWHEKVRCVGCGKETVAYGGDIRYLRGEVDSRDNFVKFYVWRETDEEFYGHFKWGDIVCGKCHDRVTEKYWNIKRPSGYYKW